MNNFDPKKPSEGLGDTIAKITHALGIDVVADKVANLLGEEDCGCDRRREALNKLVPYSEAETEYIFTKPRVYDILKNITRSLNGKIFTYQQGEKVLIDPNHPLYAGMEVYLLGGYLKRETTTTE